MHLKKLIESEIGDFFAGFGSPGQPETPEEMQRQLLARIDAVITSAEAKCWIELVTPECPSTGNLLNDGATFRMYARQLELYRKDIDIESMRETLGYMFAGSDIPAQYIQLFKMVCDLEFVESAGSAMVSHYYELATRAAPLEIEFENTEPCVLCGFVSPRPNDEHYCSGVKKHG